MTDPTTDARGLVRLTDDEIAILGAALDLYIDDKRTLDVIIARRDSLVSAARALASKLAGVL